MARSAARRRAWRVLVVAFAATYVAAMTALVWFTPWTPTNVPFLALNAIVVVNVAYVFAAAIASALPYPAPEPVAVDEPPSVALLYCTYDDADGEAIASLLDQDHTAADVYVLDDSTDPDARAVVDDAVAGTDATVVRRDDRSGFKAGALNHWLDRHGDAYDLMAVVDADSSLPPTWTSEMVRRIASDGDLAMLHSRSESHREATRFSRMLRGGIGVYMASIARAEAAAGPMLSWGHHVMIDVDAIRSIGGFTEARAEDLATSMRLMRDGWDVSYAPDVVAYEQTPPHYAAVRKRNMRWGEGTLEALSFVDRNVPGNALLSMIWRASAFLAGPALLVLVALVMLGHPSPNAGLYATWAGLVAAAASLPVPNAARTGRWGDLVAYWVASGLIALSSLVSSTWLIVKSAWDGKDFVVTPKEGERVPLGASLRTFGLEVGVGAAFVALGVWVRDPVGVLLGALLVAIPFVNTWTSAPVDGEGRPAEGTPTD